MQKVQTKAVLVTLIVLALIVSACTPEISQGSETEFDSTTQPGDQAPAPTNPETGEPEPTNPESTDPNSPNTQVPDFGAAAEGLSDLTGQLAVSTDSGELWIMDPDGFGARLVGGGDGVRLSQQTWLDAAPVLAYSHFSADLQGIGYDGLPVEDEEQSTFSEVPGNPIYYLQWSPTGSGVAFLRTSQDQRNTEFGLAVPTEPGLPLDTGAPYFVNWNSDGTAVAAHIDEARVDVWDIVDADKSTLLESDSSFAAPNYLSLSTIVVAQDNSLNLVSVSTGTTVSRLARTDGAVRFVASPEGDMVAFAGGGANSSLEVVRIDNSASVTVTEDVPFAWEWNADGTRLAWLGIGETNLAQWHFFDLEQGAEIGVSQPFRPSQFAAQNILPFFSQYALSHSRWSPDGDGFVYAGQAADGLSGIWIELVNEPDAVPTLISPGNFATWSSSAEGGGGGRNPF